MCYEAVVAAKGWPSLNKTQEGTKRKKPWMATNELHMLKASAVQKGKKDGTHLHGLRGRRRLRHRDKSHMAV